MTLKDIAVKSDLDSEEQAIFTQYIRNRFDGIEKTGASFISGKTTRFIILSAKPYSNVPASELGLSDERDWCERSLLLRQAHECTHYFTKQTYGISNNLLHDEIMADFIGIHEAFRFYKAEWFLRFMGIIEGSGNRLKFYTKDLPEKVCRAVSLLAVLSADGLERWSMTDGFKAMSTDKRIKQMCKWGFEGFIDLGSFGQPIENGRYSCAEYAIESTKTVFIMMLFHSTLVHKDWDFSWYDPKKLESFEDDIENMLSVCEDIPKQYIEMLKAAFQYQLDYINNTII